MSQPRPTFDDLPALLDAAIEGDPSPLEAYLSANSRLPSPRMNLALVEAFALLIAERVRPPDPPVDAIAALLDGWSALALEQAPVNQPREILPAAAARAYGQVAVARPDWWGDEAAKLRRAAVSPRWRTREMVAAALQAMLEANWARGLGELTHWAEDDHLLVLRAAAAGIAEPRLLTTPERGADALALNRQIIERYLTLSAEERRTDPARVLRKALGYTISVATAAAPDSGFPLLERLAQMDDADANWIARENLNKARLKR